MVANIDNDSVDDDGTNRAVDERKMEEGLEG